MERVQQETIKMEETRKQLSSFEVFGTVLTVGMLGFWFRIGATLGAKMVNSLDKLISRY